MYSRIVSTYKKECITIACAALVIRAVVFHWYIRPNEYYKQADSNDYHVAALCIRFGFGMSKPAGNNLWEPMFWRTPGYPLFLAPWYATYSPKDASFEGARSAQVYALWLQVLLNALLPVIMFALALLLTSSHAIAMAAGWITALHLGFVLASTYLLSEGIALLPFYLFLYFLYRALLTTHQSTRAWIATLAAAACMLAIYTWIRPMGQFVCVVAAVLILLFDQSSLRIRWKKMFLFSTIFVVCISPWYIRNYNLTGHWFFCPMFGTYLNSFCAPRAISKAENVPLLDAWKQLGTSAAHTYAQLKPTYTRQGLYCPMEVATALTSWPVVKRYPWYVCIDWMREVIKSTVDLYSNQLVAFATDTYFYDPIIEYVTEKWRECLYSVPMSITMRLVVYLELLYALLLWFGLCAGALRYVCVPLWRRLRVDAQTSTMFRVWISTIPIIAAVLFMTGGFGYARLRLPVEGLMIILSLTFWLPLRKQKRMQMYTSASL